jgi:ubiquitin-conjugating enzyme E2 Q
MEEPLPIGMGLRVPMPSTFSAANPAPQYSYPGIPASAVVQETPKVLEPGVDGLCDFDDLTLPQVHLCVLNIEGVVADTFFFVCFQMRGCIAKLINSLPSVIFFPFLLFIRIDFLPFR